MFTATRKMQHVGGEEDQAGSGPSVFKLIVVLGIEKMTLKPSLHHRYTNDLYGG
jgi:hypothetical protein